MKPLITGAKYTNETDKLTRLFNIYKFIGLAPGSLFYTTCSLVVRVNMSAKDGDVSQQEIEPPKPTEGTVKEGGWGGNQDPDTWQVTKMKDDPNKFKVIDNNGKNIATEFTTEANATGYIKYYEWVKVNQPPGHVGSESDVDFKSVIGQGQDKIPRENERHNVGGSQTWREELAIDQPGPDFQVDYVVKIGDSKDEVTIEYDGLAHSGDNDRSGDKIRYPIDHGDITYTKQIDTNYKNYHPGDDGVVRGKDAYEQLQKGKMYGIRVVKRNDGQNTVHVAYMQDLTDDGSPSGPPKELMRVTDHGQFGQKPRTDYKNGWRVGPRIDGKSSKNEPPYSKGIVVKKL
jgi:hypothetical protein